ncbi:MAG TPA: glycosyltransferase family 9 protein [Longimicrobiaceae bacterium]|jgi:ADP-heptose:LPS heptosyltransferase
MSRPSARRSPDPAEVRSVLVLRPDNLGDVVLFSGALRHLRARFPRARVTLCVRRYVRDLVALCPHVDRVLDWEALHEPLLDGLPRFPGRGKLDAALRFARLRLRLRPDLLLVPVRSPTDGIHQVAWAAGARRRFAVAGDDSNAGGAWARRAERRHDRVLRLDPGRGADHDLRVTRDFLALLGIDAAPEELRPELWTSLEDRRWAEAAVPRAEGAATLAIAPGVTAPAGKLYPVAKLARAVALAGEAPLRVVLFGSAGEAGLCAELGGLLAAEPGVAGVTDLSGRSTLRQMVEGIRRCDLFLGPDAGALHVAVALGLPTVGIVGGGHWGRFQPWGDPARNHVCTVPLECFGCGWSCRYETVRCVAEVPPEEVARALRSAMRALPAPEALA